MIDDKTACKCANFKFKFIDKYQTLNLDHSILIERLHGFLDFRSLFDSYKMSIKIYFRFNGVY